ncbi:uncharacterized protein TM35_000181510, partial [Trypanosoma theileri]
EKREAMASEPHRNREALAEVESQLRDRASRVAAMKKAVDALRADENEAVRARNPYLETNEVRSMPLRLLGLEDDHRAKLLRRRRQRLLTSEGRTSVEEVDLQLRENCLNLARKVCSDEDELRKEFGVAGYLQPMSGSFLYELNVTEDDRVALLAERAEQLLQADGEDCLKDVTAVRADIQARVNCLMECFLSAERQFAEELSELRAEFPMCSRDINPAVRSDDLFLVLQQAREEALSIDCVNVDTVSTIEKEQFARSVALVSDERCVLTALEKYCRAERELRRARMSRKTGPYVEQLSQEKDVTQYKHRLWRSRLNRRRVPAMLLFGVLDDEDVSTADEELCISAKGVNTLTAENSYYLYLQNCKKQKELEKSVPAVRCINEMIKIRLKQLVSDAAQAQRAERRVSDSLHHKYPFIRTSLETISQLHLNIEQDALFMQLIKERQKLQEPPKELLERYPFLSATINGVPITQLGLEEDPVFMKLAAEREDLIGPLRKTMRLVKLKEEEIREHCNLLISKAVEEEAELHRKWPYLDHLPVDVPLRELHLESYPEFTALLARHAAVCSEPERAGGAEAKRLEKAMHDLAGKIAEDVAEARHRGLVEAENLHEKYPFIPEEPAPGVALVEVGVHEDPTFCTLANELEDLRTDPVKNAERIAAMENAVCARALELAAMKLHATEEECHKYPFLSKRVDGVLLSDLHLADDTVFQELVEKREAMASEPHRNREALAEVESQLRDRASRVAAMKKAVDALRADEDEAVRARNPYLETNEVRTVPLRFLSFMGDAKFREYYRKRVVALSGETIDWEIVRIYDDLLQERVHDIASNELMRCEKVCNSFQQRGLSGNAIGTLLGCLYWNSNEIVEEILQSNASGINLKSQVNRQGVALAEVERSIAVEVDSLRLSYPMCIRDINHAVSFDENFQILETDRQALLNKFLNVKPIESVEKDERKRSIELLDDDRCVVIAAEACQTSKNKRLEDLSKDELIARWRHSLLSQRSRRRVVTFIDIAEEEVGRERRRLPAFQRKKKRTSSNSYSNLSFREVPDNVYMEIKEKNVDLGSSMNSNRTSRIFSEGTSRCDYPGNVELDENTPESPNKMRRTLLLRRLRAHRPSAGLSVDAIPDLIAYQIAEDGTISQIGGESGTSLLPITQVDSSCLQSGDGTSVLPASPLGLLDDVSPLRPGVSSNKDEKRKSLLPKKKSKVRHGKGSSISQCNMSEIPYIQAGEVVERGTESLDHHSKDSRGRTELQKQQQQEKMLRRLSGSSRTQRKHRKSANTSLTMSAVPDLEGMYVKDEEAESPPKRRQERGVQKAPEIKTKTRRMGTAREKENLTALTEEPEISFEPVQEQPKDDQTKSPMSAVFARNMMNDARHHDLSISALPHPLVPVPPSVLTPVEKKTTTTTTTTTGTMPSTTAEESLAMGATRQRPAKRPSGKKRRVKSNERRGTLTISQLEDLGAGEIHDTMESELSNARRVNSLSSPGDSSPDKLRSSRRLRGFSRPHELISQVEDNEVSCIQDDVDTKPTTIVNRRRCSFSTSSIIPLDRREERELERERRFISQILSKARPHMSRNTTEEEIESDPAAMALIFKHEDLSQIYTMRRVPIATAYMKEIEDAIIQRIIDLSREAILPGASLRGRGLRQARRQELAKRAAATASSSSKVDTTNNNNNNNNKSYNESDKPMFDVNNPLCVPQPWAHISDEELGQNEELHNLLDARNRGRGKEVEPFLREWAKKKEKENEEIFNEYPFLPPLPHGVPLSEIGFIQDDEFKRCLAVYALNHDDEKIKKEMCDIVNYMAKERAQLRNRSRSKQVSFVRRVRAACNAASPTGPGPSGASSPYDDDAAERPRRFSAKYSDGADKLPNFRDEQHYIQFVTQCKSDSIRLLKRLMVRMKKEQTADIPLSIEDIETFRYFFDAVDVGNFGVLNRNDFVDFVMLTLCESLSMTRREVEQLTFPNTPVDRLPRVVDFSDLSKFYKSLALSEVKKQDSRFPEETPWSVNTQLTNTRPAQASKHIIGSNTEGQNNNKNNTNTNNNGTNNTNTNNGTNKRGQSVDAAPRSVGFGAGAWNKSTPLPEIPSHLRRHTHAPNPVNEPIRPLLPQRPATSSKREGRKEEKMMLSPRHLPHALPPLPQIVGSSDVPVHREAWVGSRGSSEEQKESGNGNSEEKVIKREEEQGQEGNYKNEKQ